MNGVLAAAKRHGRNSHRVAGRASRDHMRQVGLVAADFRRRRPGWVGILAADVGPSRPLLTDPADPNRIADGLAGSSHVVEPPLLRANDDGARSDRLLDRHHIAARVRRVGRREGGSADGCRQECKQNLFHSLTLCGTNKMFR